MVGREQDGSVREWRSGALDLVEESAREANQPGDDARGYVLRATQSISIRTERGSPAAATVERAGRCPAKCFA